MYKYIALIVLLTACSQKPKDKELKWYKGNTHAHTVLCGHADTQPDSVALWYLNRDYNFLILSEHNQFIDPDSVNLPKDRREDFILIPGEEVSDHYYIHTTAMNINRFVSPQRPNKLPDLDKNRFKNYKIYLMQKHTDSIRSAGGIPIINHPNWQTGVSAADIQMVERLHMIELYNGHPDINNWGTKVHASMEQKWDSILTAGRKVFAVSSDDAHFFKKWSAKTSNPGRGWVMVQSKDLTPAAITKAMSAGNFYASNGVILKKINKSNESYKIEIDKNKTLKELESPFVAGHKTGKESEGFKITFISDKGKIIQETKELSAILNVPKGVQYVRAKITFTRATASGSERFYAWTQPLFLD